MYSFTSHPGKSAAASGTENHSCLREPRWSRVTEVLTLRSEALQAPTANTPPPGGGSSLPALLSWGRSLTSRILRPRLIFEAHLKAVFKNSGLTKFECPARVSLASHTGSIRECSPVLQGGSQGSFTALGWRKAPAPTAHSARQRADLNGFPPSSQFTPGHTWP